MKILTHRVLPSEAKKVKADLAAMKKQIASGDTLNLGDKGPAVAALQRHLASAGVYKGPISGVFDEATRAATAAFQTAKGLKGSGVVGGGTLARLRETNKFVKDGFEDPARVGQRGSDILRAEKMLEKLGFRPGKVDGIFDAATAAAVQRYRKADAEVADKGKAIGKKFYDELSKASKAYNHDPYRKRVIGGVKAHRRLDAATAKAAAKGDGLGLGDKGRSVLNVEKHLEAAGYELGTTNRTFGARTEAAVKAFQRRSGLPETGRVDARTWARLKGSLFAAESRTSPSQRVGEKSAAVLATEKKLKKLGYDVGKVDGLYTERTERAVERFQKKHHLEVTGKVGTGTLKRINDALEPHGSAKLAANARQVALGMGGYHSQGLCATGVSRAIERTYGIKVWGNGNQIDDNLPRSRFKRVHMSLAQALKIPGLILTWEKTSTSLGSIYGHTAITLGDGHSTASDFIESNTLGGSSGRSGLKIFMPR